MPSRSPRSPGSRASCPESTADRRACRRLRRDGRSDDRRCAGSPCAAYRCGRRPPRSAPFHPTQAMSQRARALARRIQLRPYLDREQPLPPAQHKARTLRPSPKRRCDRLLFIAADFASLGTLLSSPARSRMLNMLLRGQALPASELSQSAGVALSTGSEHLAELSEGGLVRVEVHGRHRYYSLASPKVAEALESLANICEPAPVRTLRESISRERLRRARTCYDHLAGMVGVALLDGMLAEGLLEKSESDCSLTRSGRKRLTRLGVEVDHAEHARRAFARLCLDWTERRHHLGGALGAAISSLILERGWLQRSGRSRALSLGPHGRESLMALGI